MAGARDSRLREAPVAHVDATAASSNTPLPGSPPHHDRPTSSDLTPSHILSTFTCSPWSCLRSSGYYLSRRRHVLPDRVVSTLKFHHQHRLRISKWRCSWGRASGTWARLQGRQGGHGLQWVKILPLPHQNWHVSPFHGGLNDKAGVSTNNREDFLTQE